MDQRFPASEERQFKRSLQPSFVIPMYVGALVTIVAAMRKQNQVFQSTDRDDQLNLYSACRNCAIIIASLIHLLIVRFRSWSCRWLCAIDLEAHVIGHTCVMVTLLSWGGDWYLAALLGRDPYEVWGNSAGGSQSI